MVISDFIEMLKEHNVDFDTTELFVVPFEEDADGYDFSIEDSDFAIFLCAREDDKDFTYRKI